MTDSVKALVAVNNFMRSKDLSFGVSYRLNVHVENIIDEDINVQISRKNNNFYNVNIFWEDIIINYKNLGLHGYYSTMYCKFYFENESLIIVDSNGKKIILK